MNSRWFTSSLFSLILWGSWVVLGETQAVEQAVVEGAVTVVDGAPRANEGVVLTFTSESAAPALSTQTDENGRFRVGGFPPGRYALSVRKTGFVRDPHDSGPVTLSLFVGEHIKDVHLRLIRTGAVSGRITDQNGDPKAGAVVLAIRSQFDRSRELLSSCTGVVPRTGIRVDSGGVVRATADESGNYRLYGIEPGSYVLVVVSESCDVAPEFYPGVRDPADAIQVRVPAGADLTNIDFKTSKSNLYTVRFRPVPQPTETPVFLQAIRRSRNGLETIVLQQTLMTSRLPGDGVLISPPLPAGSYDFYYSAGASLTNLGQIGLEIVDRNVDAGVMTVRAAVTIKGLLRADGIALGSPVRIRLDDLEGERFVHSFFPVRVASDGNFSIEGVLPRRYQVAIEGQGLPQDAYLAAAQYNARNVLDGALVIEGGEPGILALTVAMGGSIDGVVKDARGEAVRSSRVVIVPVANRRANTTLYKTAMTDQHGRFTLNGVAPGDYGVLAWESVPANAWLNQSFLAPVDGRSQKVTVRAGLRNSISVRVITRE